MLYFDNFEISKREILIGIAIIAIMIVIGIVIHGAIDDALMIKYQEYNLALQVENDAKMFSHAMETNVGNAFVYGDLESVDSVTFDEIGGEYSSITKVKERYTRHSRIVTKTRTVNGKTKTYTTTEYYYSWDPVDRESKKCSKITFIGEEFDYGTIPFPNEKQVELIKESANIRYVYYASPAKTSGTVYANLNNNTINDAKFYNEQTIEETIERLESRWELILFWIGWVVLTGAVLFGFVYLDNRWLEDEHSYGRRRYYC